MADHSTYELATNNLEDTIDPLTQHQTTLTNNQQDLSHNIDSILEQLPSLTTSPHASPHHHLHHQPPHPPIKMDLPQFNGLDPMS